MSDRLEEVPLLPPLPLVPLLALLSLLPLPSLVTLLLTLLLARPLLLLVLEEVAADVAEVSEPTDCEPLVAVTSLEEDSDPPLSCAEEETGAIDSEDDGAAVTLEAVGAVVAEESAIWLDALAVLAARVDDVAGIALALDKAAAVDNAAAVEDGTKPLADADECTCPAVDKGWQSARQSSSATTRQQR